MQQGLLIADGDLRQLVEMIDHLAAHLARQIAVLGLADIQLRLPEQAEAVRFDRADVIRVLMRDEDMPDRTRVYAEPAHLFLEPAVVIPGVDHDGRVALAVEEDICHPLAHTGDVLVDPAGVQRLEDLLAAVHFAHFFFLEFRCLFRHMTASYFALRQQNHAMLFRFPARTASYVCSSRPFRLKTVS